MKVPQTPAMKGTAGGTDAALAAAGAAVWALVQRFTELSRSVGMLNYEKEASVDDRQAEPDRRRTVSWWQW